MIYIAGSFFSPETDFLAPSAASLETYSSFVTILYAWDIVIHTILKTLSKILDIYLENEWIILFFIVK